MTYTVSERFRVFRTAGLGLVYAALRAVGVPAF